MEIPFSKYQGTGNDFVMIDNRSLFFPKNNTKLIHKICDRKFGIGADGLILLEDHSEVDFRMVYYNSDGNLSSMCGNGGRCLVHFANSLGMIDSEATFEAVDGMHTASIKGNLVSLKMNDVAEVFPTKDAVYLDTGSPHHVTMVNDLDNFNVKTNGAAIRYDVYGEEGANVNFVEKHSENIFKVRTYERGVENETLSCGTGVTAVAIAMSKMGETNKEEITLSTPGGDLMVSFKKEGEAYREVYLKGPATFVFKGIWKI